MDADVSLRRARSPVVIASTAVVVLVAGAALIWTIRDDDETAEVRPVDRALAAAISGTGVTPYVVDFDGARLRDVRVEGAEVFLSYDVDDVPLFTLVLEKSRPGDLCQDHDDSRGGSCLADGDRVETEFEEFGTFGVRRDDTMLTMASVVIESDPDIGERAYAALEAAERVGVDDLARR
ncbi:hypothetical protein ASE01_17710 [Nocardioides sp. Root190]|uniref:hypothetical protein n=1 Tax=Nocardioides sp. Root190 TaxID=1736488 RepID=UPI0006FE906A|nr:hypothetical protein [Nocardioides sp. Root190]KRB73853.1 hypothetical protein ASE01_17710 [Nocardioides sp. Root190]